MASFLAVTVPWHGTGDSAMAFEMHFRPFMPRKTLDVYVVFIPQRPWLIISLLGTAEEAQETFGAHDKCSHWL